MSSGHCKEKELLGEMVDCRSKDGGQSEPEMLFCAKKIRILNDKDTSKRHGNHLEGFIGRTGKFECQKKIIKTFNTLNESVSPQS